MRPSTEDLLSVRDGEPLAAATRAAIEASPESGHDVEQLRAVQRWLQELPELAPPAGAWERIVAAEQRTAAASRRITRALAGLGVAAAVALVAVIVVVGPSDDSVVIVRSPSLAGQTMAYTELVAESARLERLLAEIPPQSLVVRLGTVSTIVGLEDQIALVDEQLSYGDAIGLEGAQRAALWGERVDLLNALVLVRAAHAQDIVFQTVAGDTL
jgi:hypothetical protein